MDPGPAPSDPGINPPHPALPAKPPRMPPKVQREALCKHAGVGAGYTCCLTCLKPADAEHRRNWLDCARCYVHGDGHVGDLCPLLKAMRLAFLKTHAGETKKQIIARSRSGWVVARRKRESKRSNNARQGDQVQHGGLPGIQVLPGGDLHAGGQIRSDPAARGHALGNQVNGHPPFTQGHEVQLRRSRSPARGAQIDEAYQARSPPTSHQGGGHLQPQQVAAEQLHNSQPNDLPLITQPPAGLRDHQDYRHKLPHPRIGSPARSNSPLRFTFVGYEGDEDHLWPRNNMLGFDPHRRRNVYGHAERRRQQPRLLPAQLFHQREVNDAARVLVLQQELTRLVDEFGQSRSEEIGRQILELSAELDAFAISDHRTSRMDNAGGARVQSEVTGMRSRPVNESEDGVLLAKEEQGKEFYLVKAEKGARSVFRPDLIQ